jgi:hypothetical protein
MTHVTESTEDTAAPPAPSGTHRDTGTIAAHDPSMMQSIQEGRGARSAAGRERRCAIVENTRYPGPGHAQETWRHLQAFGTVLTKRWQKEVASAYCNRRQIVTNVLKNGKAPVPFEWDYLKIAPVDYHRADCEFRFWAEDTSLDGPLPKCRGQVTTGIGDRFTDVDGVSKSMPTKIECPVPHLLRQVPSWAAAECAVLWGLVPYFDAQDQAVLSAAYTALSQIQKELNPAGGSEKGDSGPGQLANTVAELSGSGKTDSWWTEWTGLAADALRQGFLSSPKPTMDNHYFIATNLARLIDNRARIIEYGRNNTIDLIDQATKELSGVTTKTEESETHWKLLTAGAMVLGVASAGSLALASEVAAGAFELAVFLAEAVVGEAEIKVTAFAKDFRPVLGSLASGLRELTFTKLVEKEQEYADYVGDVREAVNGVGSFDLELYDFNENSSHKPTKEAVANAKKPDDGYNVNTATVMNLARGCTWAGQDYERMLGMFGPIPAAKGHLTDRKGEERESDADVLALVEEFRGYLETTSARYFAARDLIADAAKAYEYADGDVSDSMKQLFDNWETRDPESKYEPKAFKVDEAVDPTARPDDADRDPYREGTNPDGSERDVYGTEKHESESEASR